ncbi:cyclopropane-fatty-acyl-phospholipid synthase [Rhodococcus sp. SMB37]|uniref:class I SAM-dependent methyltransferase n=1 Tax=Rhodococcus sp. SMB37 TaxID=2512213 RepID=UPI0010E317BC|nr:class I SAM-dependent methyltransferase [Rhodococcus sp. SMB37]TCN49034.1 cyclopropane-fatty-acyl-phospholipid synthase [Rhodococcus sp. SMB37]
MTTFKAEPSGRQTDRLNLAQIVEIATGGQMPLRFSAYDGSTTGPADAQFGLNLTAPEGATYIVTAPGDLGMARAYVSGTLEAEGVHPADPYPLLKALGGVHFERPPARTLAQIVRSLGPDLIRPIAPPPQEHLPRWRRVAEGFRHSKARDAEVIHHHYDVSNKFYEYVLGPSMTYTCAVFESENQSLEDAQENKYRLVFEKLRLKPGDRLLDIGCGWGGMVRYAARRGVKAIGATLSKEQAEWAQKAIAEEGLGDLAEVRHSDYRDVSETGFDAISSIGLTEHIGAANYPSYFRFLHDKLRVGGLLLNHSITRPHNRGRMKAGGFIDRYVFPDGELTGSGRLISEAQNIGFEVMHEENLRQHYALTLKAWCENLEEHWDSALSEVDEATARLWGLYMAGSRVGFETNGVQLHQILGVKLGEDQAPQVPLRPWWVA